MELGLQQKLTLKQKLTPQMIQSLKFLQTTIYDLNLEIQKEMEENPIFDLEHNENLENHKTEKEISNESNKNNENIFESKDINLMEKKNEFSSEDWRELYEGQGKTFETYKSRNPDYDELYDLDRKEGNPKTLKQHLLVQASLTFSNNLDLDIAQILIENLNHDGLLEEYTEIDDNNEHIFTYIKKYINNLYEEDIIDEDDVQDILNQIHLFDPIGCGAFNKIDTLYIQAKNKGYDDNTLSIIKNDLETLADNKWKLIKEKYNISDVKIQEIIEKIKTLDPIPARNFSPQRPIPIIPEVRLIKTQDGYKAELIKEKYPRLRLSTYYQNRLRQNISEEERAYLENKLQAAQNTIKALELRKATILRVAEAIASIQKEFFDSKGKEETLKAMSLKNIANELGLDNSTISRATKGKYLDSDIGLYELKYFFSTSVKVIGGENQSMKVVKVYYKKIIDEEDKRKPLSDEKISKILKAKYNMIISRKTIGNYRQSMGIPSTTKRKQHF